MKTIELKWIEDDNHVVAEDAYTGLKELIEDGVFPNLKVKCENDTLYITGEKEDLDKAVLKIQQSYSKYGQIMIKEAVSQLIKIESFDENTQDIFNHTLNEYETFIENKHKNNNYITTLGKFSYRFNKLKEAAKGKDKNIFKNILNEIDELTESFEDIKIKPINEEYETLDDVENELHKIGYGPAVSRALVRDYRRSVMDWLKRNSAKEVAKMLSKAYLNENMLKETIEDVINELIELGNEKEDSKAIVEERLNFVKRRLDHGDKAMDVAISLDKNLNESTDNCSILEEKALGTRKIRSRAELVRKAKKQDAIEITDYDEFLDIKKNQLMNEIAYSMDINGNKTGAIFVGDRDGKFYYTTKMGILIRI